MTITATPFTRADYMRASDPDEAHRRYYAQFVTDSVLWLVSARIGAARIRASTDPHFNDIPLRSWDALEPAIRDLCLSRMGDINGRVDHNNGIAWSLSDAVCIAKEAARQIKACADAVWLVQSAPFGSNGPWTTIATYTTEEQADDCIAEIARTLPHEHFRTRKGAA